MSTIVLSPTQIDTAVEFLKNGELVAIPTETVYGLAADACNDSALRKVFEAKGRPSTHPLILHLESLEQAKDWAQIPSMASQLAHHFWPGPMTLLFRKQAHVSDVLTAGLDTIAIRVPEHPIALEVIRRLGHGIAAPSANTHKKVSPTHPNHVLRTLNGKIAAVIDGGACSVGIESTIVDMTKKQPVILRPGALSASMIAQCLGLGNIEYGKPHQERVAGNMKDHYQPNKPLFIMNKQTLLTTLQQEKKCAVLHYSELMQTSHSTYYKLPTDPRVYANKLYRILHEIDQTSVDKILVEQPPLASDWAGVNDRLTKASTK